MAKLKSTQIYGNLDVTGNVSGNFKGNASTATKLQTARTINGTNFDGSANITTSNWGTARNLQVGNTSKSVNGSANVAWSLSEIGAFPTAGGTMTGSIKFSGGGYNSHAIRMEAGDSNGAFIGIGAGGLTVIGSGESTNAVRTALTNGADETMIVASDQTIRFLTGVQNGYASAKEVSINASGVINAPQGMTGNASTATKLQTSRSINGTNFDGSGNITTANWGTARNIQIGNTAKSVNGSGNVSWSLGEIGAVPVSTGSSVTVHADSDSSSASEYLLLKAGHNELKVTSSAGGSTVTKSNTNLTYNGNQVYHAGNPQTTVSGNAGTATKLQNARKLGAANFDGTGNVPVTSMLGLNTTKSSGNGFKNKFTKIASINVNGAWSTCSGKLFFTSGENDFINGILNFYFRSNGDNNATSIALKWETLTNSSYADSIRAVKTSTGKYDLYYMPKGDYEILKFYAIASEIDKMTLYANQNYVDSITAAATSTLSAVSGSTTGNAGSATKLQTARSINGTNFDGTGNITTANWGTARTITIGGTGKSVNGSGNVSWSLSEIGAAAASHTHNYAGSSSAGGNANAAVKLATARSINGTNFDGTGNITTANWGTARTLTIGNTGKSVNGSGNVSWSLSEIGAAASSHNHGLLHDNFGVSIADTTTDSGWSMINSSYNGYILKSIRTNASAPAWLVNNYGAGVAFGGSDTKGVLSVAYSSPSIRFAGGNGSKPVWYMSLTGSSGKSYNMDSLAAATATKLATARTINGTSFDGTGNITTANWGTARTITIGGTGKSVNGSGNVSWSLSEIGAAAASHTHSYLPLSGGDMTGAIKSNLTCSHVEGFKGRAIISSTGNAGTHVAVAKTNSNKGHFTLISYQDYMGITYATKTKVDGGTNGFDYGIKLLDEKGISTLRDVILENGGEITLKMKCPTNSRNVGLYTNANNWGVYDYSKDASIIRYNFDGNRVEVQGKRVVTWDGSNPSHYTLRYGSGLGGANGYITFSY